MSQSTLTSRPASPSRAAGLLKERRNLVLWLLGALVVLLVIVLPLLSPSGFTYRTMTSMFLLIATAQGWNLIGGYTGYASFGNVAFFGLGAYVTGILMFTFNWPFLPTVALGGLVAAAYAALIGLPVLRLRGHYFAIATLGVAEATREVIAWATPVTYGASGISLPILRPISYAQDFFYYLALALVLAGMGLTWALSRRKIGYSWVAIRADEDGARMLGINTTASKVAAFALGALLTGMAGSVYAYYNTFIAPEEVFKVDRTLQAILATVMGGGGTVAGPVAGALIYQLVESFLIFGKPFGIDLGQLHVTILGLFIVLVTIFTPRGLIDLFVRSIQEAQRKGGSGARPQAAWATLVNAAGAFRAVLVQNVRQFKV